MNALTQAGRSLTSAAAVAQLSKVVAAVAIIATLVVALTRLGVEVVLPAAVLARVADGRVVAAAVAVGLAQLVALAGTHPVVDPAATQAGLSPSACRGGGKEKPVVSICSSVSPAARSHRQDTSPPTHCPLLKAALTRD